MKRVVCLLLCVLFALSLFGCGGGSTEPTPTPATPTPAAPTPDGGGETPDEPLEPIRIGLIYERSGAMAHWGIQEYRGFRVGLLYATNGTMEIDGRPIELFTEDTASDVGTAVRVATRLIEDVGVHVLSGTAQSQNALAVMPLIETAGIPYVIGCAAVDAITGEFWNEWTFRTGRNLYQGIAANNLAREVINPGGMEGSTWSFISPDFVGGREGVESAVVTVEAEGGIVLDTMFPPLDTMDFSPYLQRIRQSQPDFLMVQIIGDNFTVQLPQQFQDMGLSQHTQFLSAITDHAFLETIGEAGIGIAGECVYHYSLFDTPANAFLIEMHQELFNGLMPDYWSGQSFASAQAIVEAIRLAGSTEPAAIQDALRGLEFFSIKGRMFIRPEDHQAMQDMAIAIIISDGQGGVTLEPLGIIPADQITPPITAPGRG